MTSRKPLWILCRLFAVTLGLVILLISTTSLGYNCDFKSLAYLKTARRPAVFTTEAERSEAQEINQEIHDRSGLTAEADGVIQRLTGIQEQLARAFETTSDKSEYRKKVQEQAFGEKTRWQRFLSHVPGFGIKPPALKREAQTDLAPLHPQKFGVFRSMVVYLMSLDSAFPVRKWHVQQEALAYTPPVRRIINGLRRFETNASALETMATEMAAGGNVEGLKIIQFLARQNREAAQAFIAVEKGGSVTPSLKDKDAIESRDTAITEAQAKVWEVSKVIRVLQQKDGADARSVLADYSKLAEKAETDLLVRIYEFGPEEIEEVRAVAKNWGISIREAADLRYRLMQNTNSALTEKRAAELVEIGKIYGVSPVVAAEFAIKAHPESTRLTLAFATECQQIADKMGIDIMEATHYLMGSKIGVGRADMFAEAARKTGRTPMDVYAEYKEMESKRDITNGAFVRWAEIAKRRGVSIQKVRDAEARIVDEGNRLDVEGYRLALLPKPKGGKGRGPELKEGENEIDTEADKYLAELGLRFDIEPRQLMEDFQEMDTLARKMMTGRHTNISDVDIVRLMEARYRRAEKAKTVFAHMTSVNTANEDLVETTGRVRKLSNENVVGLALVQADWASEQTNQANRTKKTMGGFAKIDAAIDALQVERPKRVSDGTRIDLLQIGFEYNVEPQTMAFLFGRAVELGKAHEITDAEAVQVVGAALASQSSPISQLTKAGNVGTAPDAVTTKLAGAAEKAPASGKARKKYHPQSRFIADATTLTDGLLTEHIIGLQRVKTDVEERARVLARAADAERLEGELAESGRRNQTLSEEKQRLKHERELAAAQLVRTREGAADLVQEVEIQRSQAEAKLSQAETERSQAEAEAARFQSELEALRLELEQAKLHGGNGQNGDGKVSPPSGNGDGRDKLAERAERLSAVGLGE